MIIRAISLVLFTGHCVSIFVYCNRFRSTAGACFSCNGLCMLKVFKNRNLCIPNHNRLPLLQINFYLTDISAFLFFISAGNQFRRCNMYSATRCQSQLRYIERVAFNRCLDTDLIGHRQGNGTQHRHYPQCG